MQKRKKRPNTIPCPEYKANFCIVSYHNFLNSRTFLLDNETKKREEKIGQTACLDLTEKGDFLEQLRVIRRFTIRRCWVDTGLHRDGIARKSPRLRPLCPATQPAREDWSGCSFSRWSDRGSVWNIQLVRILKKDGGGLTPAP